MQLLHFLSESEQSFIRALMAFRLYASACNILTLTLFPSPFLFLPLPSPPPPCLPHSTLAHPARVGRMKGIAFVYDPDGYWVELVERAEGALGAPTFTFAQTMLRVKDPKNSVPFYTERMGMTLVRESHYSYFSLFFLASMPEGFKMVRRVRGVSAGCPHRGSACGFLEAALLWRREMPASCSYARVLPCVRVSVSTAGGPHDRRSKEVYEGRDLPEVGTQLHPLTPTHLHQPMHPLVHPPSHPYLPLRRCIPVLELTHNHGTETQADFAHFNGNAEPRRGFGHVAFVVDDVYACCEGLEKGGVELQKKPDDGASPAAAERRHLAAAAAWLLGRTDSSVGGTELALASLARAPPECSRALLQAALLALVICRSVPVAYLTGLPAPFPLLLRPRVLSGPAYGYVISFPPQAA